MKKYIFYPRWLPIYLAFSLVAADFIYFKSFAYAEDTLAAFQQEVIYAKQKQQAIVPNINDAALEKEAQSLLMELEQKGYSIQSKSKTLEQEKEAGINAPVQKTPSKKWPWELGIKSLLVSDKPVKEIKLEPMKGASKKRHETLDTRDSGWFWRKIGYKEKKPSDGEMLYRVAVSDNKITLNEAIDIAMANSIQIKALQKKVEAAKAKLTEAKRALYPTVQGVLERNGGLASEVGGGDPHGRFYKGGNEKINVTQPLFYGGELHLTVKQAEVNVQSVEVELKKAKVDTIHQVKTAYYGAVKSEYNLQYQNDLYHEINDIHQRILKEHGQKIVSEIDYLNTESQYQQVYFQVESAKNDLQSAALVLQQTLNLPSDTNFPMDLHLNFVKISPDMDEVVETALKNNPDVLMKQYAYESAKYGVDVFHAKKYPHVDLKGSYGYLGENFQDSKSIEDAKLPGAKDNAIDPEKEWFLGVQTSMPLGPNSVEYSQVKHQYGPTVLALHGSEDWSHKVTFNLFDKLADITDEKSAQAALLQSQSEYEKAKNDVTLKIRDDFYNLQKSLIQIDSSAAKMRYQEKQNGVLRYMVGIQETQIQNLLEGLIEMAQDRFSFIQAITDYHLAVSSLNQSIGDSDYFDAEPK